MSIALLLELYITTTSRAIIEDIITWEVYIDYKLNTKNIRIAYTLKYN